METTYQFHLIFTSGKHDFEFYDSSSCSPISHIIPVWTNTLTLYGVVDQGMFPRMSDLICFCTVWKDVEEA